MIITFSLLEFVDMPGQFWEIQLSIIHSLSFHSVLLDRMLVLRLYEESTVHDDGCVPAHRLVCQKDSFLVLGKINYFYTPTLNRKTTGKAISI